MKNHCKKPAVKNNKLKIINIKNNHNHNHNHIQYTITASKIISYVTVSTTCSSTTQYCSTVASKLNTHLSSSISIYAGIVSLVHLSNPATTNTISYVNVFTSASNTTSIELTQQQQQQHWSSHCHKIIIVGYTVYESFWISWEYFLDRMHTNTSTVKYLVFSLNLGLRKTQ